MVSKQMENVIKLMLNARDERTKKRVEDSREGLEANYNFKKNFLILF